MARNQPSTHWQPPEPNSYPEPDPDRWFKYNEGPPFSVGDTVTINESGFSIEPGEPYKVTKVKWVSNLKEWCINLHIDNNYNYGWRARRFELVTTAKEKTVKNYDFVMCAMLGFGKLEAPVVYCDTDYAAMDAIVRDLLKEDPTKQYVYGRLDRHAFVDMPPIKIKQL